MITVKRIVAARDGIFGVLLGDDGLPWMLTLEPTLDETFKPVIPEGVYIAQPTYYHKGGYNTYEVMGVAGHSRLLFHVGNTEDDTIGCILLGTSFGVIGGKKALLSSRKAFERFMFLVPGYGFQVRFTS